MTEGNVPAPTRTDDQLVLVKARLAIRKEQSYIWIFKRRQKNPIFTFIIGYPNRTPLLRWLSRFGQCSLLSPFTIYGNTLTMDPKTEYYQKYLEIATRKPRQLTTTTDEESVKKKKVPPTDKSKKPSPAKQTKLVKEKSIKPTPSKKSNKGKVLKV
ncbi:hypothetical protein Tco_0768680 [Tanacetum coccineum]